MNDDSDIGEISDLQVMQSGAGFYVGHSYWDIKMQGWFPWSRESDYMTEEDAKKYLDFVKP